MRSHVLNVALSFRPKHWLQAILDQAEAGHQPSGWGISRAASKGERMVFANGSAGTKERGKDVSKLTAGQNRDVGF